MRRVLVALGFLAAACNGLSQSPECASYLACVEAVTPGGSLAYQSSYGQTGTCWSTDQRAADACSATCTQGRQFLGLDAGAGKAACQ
jgi:hypothetical protein